MQYWEVFYQFHLKLGGNENEENQGNEENELTIEDLEEGFKRLNIRVDNDQIRGYLEFLLKGGNENEANEENEVTMEDLEEGFKSLNIRVDNHGPIILRILDLLRKHNIQDKREKSIQFVMKYAKKYRPKMTILHQEFVDALGDFIEANTVLGEIIDCEDYEPPPKREKPGSR